MIPDREVLEEVLEELLWDPIVATTEIRATIRNGVVTLHGEVPSFAAMVAAEEDAGRVPGVRAVRMELEIRASTSVEISDAEIAASAKEALERNVFVPTGSIAVRVDRGTVMLSGRVNDEFERAAAERALRYIPGVQGVTDRVVVSPPPASRSVRLRPAPASMEGLGT